MKRIKQWVAWSIVWAMGGACTLAQAQDPQPMPGRWQEVMRMEPRWRFLASDLNGRRTVLYDTETLKREGDTVHAWVWKFEVSSQGVDLDSIQARVAVQCRRREIAEPFEAIRIDPRGQFIDRGTRPMRWQTISPSSSEERFYKLVCAEAQELRRPPAASQAPEFSAQAADEQAFMARVRAAVPDFDEITTDPAWQTYLLDEGHGYTLKHKHELRDLQGVVAVFDHYRIYRQARRGGTHAAPVRP